MHAIHNRVQFQLWQDHQAKHQCKDGQNSPFVCLQSATDYVPNVGIRFDYTQTAGTGTAECSLFYCDRFDNKLSAINGLAIPNLVQVHDWNILDKIQALKEG